MNRCNDQPDTPVFFEIKRRADNAILKQRGGVKRAAMDCLLGGHMPEPAGSARWPVHRSSDEFEAQLFVPPSRMNKQMKKGRSRKNETSMNDTNKDRAGKHKSKRIHFEFTSPTAESVSIAGTFNDWQPNATPMIALGQGRWAKDLALPPGDYEYCLVVDGQWTPDPQVSETIPNPFGGVNSVRKVGNGC